MKAELISIGDELLVGQTVNTNASYLGRELTALGVDVGWVTTIGDNAEDVRASLSTALARADLVIMTGGLGPTHDDITKPVVADFFGARLLMNEDVLARLKSAFAARGIRMAKVNEGQAMVPEGATVIDNPAGTAPGLLFEREGKRCVVLPGVPGEMKAIFKQTLAPMLKGSGHFILQKTLRTTGIAESTLFEKVGDIDEIQRLVKVAFLPKGTGVDIRLTAASDDEEACRETLQQGEQIFIERAGKYIYARDDQPLEDAVAAFLVRQGKTLAVAESCTGGLLANKLTNVPGSSAYFERGVVSYSNEAKIELLGLPENVIAEHGAVSAETAEAMAMGIRRSAGTDFGLATTGIAGPTGGTAEKPVGLVYIALATSAGVRSKRLQFTRDRLGNKERTVQAALNWLRLQLAGFEG